MAYRQSKQQSKSAFNIKKDQKLCELEDLPVENSLCDRSGIRFQEDAIIVPLLSLSGSDESQFIIKCQ